MAETQERYNLGDNVIMTKVGTSVVITIDMSKDLGPSASGKNHIVATTRGNVTLPGTGGIKLGVNCYKSA